MRVLPGAKAVLLAAALAAVSVACGPGRGPAAPTSTPVLPILKIATQSPLTGDRAALGAAIHNGVQLAVEQRTARMATFGFRVNVVPFNDRARPDMGVANAEEIVADPSIVLVIGHLTSTVALPASEVYHRAGLAMISPANSDPRLTDRGFDTVSRVVGRDDGQGEAGAVFAAADLRAERVFIVHDGTAEGRAVAVAFRQRGQRSGLRVLGEALLGRDIDPVVQAAGGADLLYLSLAFPQAGAVMREARAKGSKAAFLGSDWLDSPEILRIAGRAAIDAYYTTVAGPPSFYPGGEAFMQAYRRRFTAEPLPFALQAYDAANLGLEALARAITAAGGRPSRRQVAAAIRRVPFRGLTGTFVLDGRGDPDPATYFVLGITSANPLESERRRPVRVLHLPPPGR